MLPLVSPASPLPQDCVMSFPCSQTLTFVETEKDNEETEEAGFKGQEIQNTEAL